MLYLSSLLQEHYPRFYHNFTEELKKHHISFCFIEGSKDIWMRDFMPVRSCFGEYIQFRYEPSYLKDYKHLQSNSKNLKAVSVKEYSNINLDGGNLIRRGDVAIISERIYSENLTLSKAYIDTEIKALLRLSKLVIVKDDKEDMTGHVDGMCRFIDDKRILVNDLSYNKRLEQSVYESLESNGFEIVPLHVKKSFYEEAQTDWAAYINFIVDDGIIFLPIHNIKNDVIIIKQFTSLFREYTIVPIDVNEIAITKGIKGGGALHCITWSDEDESHLLPQELFRVFKYALLHHNEKIHEYFESCVQFIEYKENTVYISTQSCSKKQVKHLREYYSRIKMILRDIYGYDTQLQNITNQK